MSSRTEPDVLADMVVRDVPPRVRATMTEEQIKAVRSAVERSATKRRHAIDVRFVLPLLFTQIYVVLLVGKDTRTATLLDQEERRARAGFHVSAVAIAIASAIAIAAAFAALYVMKSSLGLDLFDGHLKDYLPFLR